MTEYDPLVAHPCEKCGKSIMGKFALCFFCGMETMSERKETMSTQSPVPKDHPLMIAWEAYKKTEDYENSVRWAKATKVSIDQSEMGSEAAFIILDHPHLEGALWGLFAEGFRAGQGVVESAPKPDAIRDLVPTLYELLGHVPISETSLIARLSSIRRSAEFAPPEGMGHWWSQARAVLQDEIGKPSTEWQRTVEEIFSGRPCPFIPEEPVSVVPDVPESYGGTE